MENPCFSKPKALNYFEIVTSDWPLADYRAVIMKAHKRCKDHHPAEANTVCSLRVLGTPEPHARSHVAAALPTHKTQTHLPLTVSCPWLDKEVFRP